MAICKPSCNTVAITPYTTSCDRRLSTRRGGISQFALLDCDLTFVDITDEEEWEAGKTAGQIVLSPEGFGSLVEPTETAEKLTACSPEETIDEISGIDFSTKLFDNVGYTDFDFENQVKNGYSSRTLVWFGCDGLMYYDRNWVTGTNPGFSDLSIRTYRTSEADALQQLFINSRFNTYATGLKAIPLTTALKEAIFG